MSSNAHLVIVSSRNGSAMVSLIVRMGQMKRTVRKMEHADMMNGGAMMGHAFPKDGSVIKKRIV